MVFLDNVRSVQPQQLKHQEETNKRFNRQTDKHHANFMFLKNPHTPKSYKQTKYHF